MNIHQLFNKRINKIQQGRASRTTIELNETTSQAKAMDNLITMKFGMCRNLDVRVGGYHGYYK